MTATHPRRLLGAFVLAAMLAVLARPAPAFACSCVMMEPDEFAGMQDAAFVGTLVEQSGESWTFDVEQVVAGEVPAVVTVHSPVGDGANCGLILDEGTRIGVGLQGTPQGWSTSGCSTIDADVLLAAEEGYAPVAVTDTVPDDDGGGSGGPLIVLAVAGVGTAAVFGAVALASRRRSTVA